MTGVQTCALPIFRLVRTPAIALVAKEAGLDFFMFDMEHGPISFETVSDAASLARAAGIDCYVRVPELTKGYVSRALDCGVTGVMVPSVPPVHACRPLMGDWVSGLIRPV